MIKLTLMEAGYCTHPEFMVMRGGQRKSVRFPAICALLEHPKLGPILFDTGYTSRFFTETQQFPNSLYAKITPVYLDESKTARRQLETRGIAVEDVRHLIISHFHADHIAGLADFPHAQYIYFDQAYAAVRCKSSFGAVRAGFLPGLLPPDFEERSVSVKSGGSPAQSGSVTHASGHGNALNSAEGRAHSKLRETPFSPNPSNLASLPAKYAPFDYGFDLFGDKSIIAVHLPGHAYGQMGLFLETQELGPVFLAADACWHSKAYRELIWPHPLANLALADPKAFRDTLTKLHLLHKNNPQITIIPSHCREVLAEIGE